MYRGHLRSRAYSKEALAKPLMESSVLYMARATPTPYCNVRSLCRLSPACPVRLSYRLVQNTSDLKSG